MFHPEGLQLKALRLFDWNCESSISNIAPMVNCWATTLEYFTFRAWGDGTVDISALSQCSSLRFLDLSCNNLMSDLSPLSSCISLESFNLDETNVTDVSP